jgi:PIN domain nuclease of toxin-antitoxin system
MRYLLATHSVIWASEADPFDRVIVATARYHALPLITRDQAITRSGLVDAVWQKMEYSTLPNQVPTEYALSIGY